MNPLALMGGPFTTLAAALLAGVLLGGVGAWKVQAWRADAKQAAELREAQRLNTKRESVTASIGKKYEQQREKVHVVTVKQIERVQEFVGRTDFPMSPGFRVFHDAAAAGEVPDPARVADATFASAESVASTVAQNYGACLDAAGRLTALQEWIREQQGVK